MDDRSGLPWREAVRALVMDPERRVLLVHFDFSHANYPDGFWACPGGGKEPGETDEQTIRRELREEVGLELPHPLGTPIWDKNHRWPAGAFSGQHDVFYAVRADPFEPRGSFHPDQLRAEHIDRVRWWGWDELHASSEVFSPRSIVALLDDLVTNGPPPAPVALFDG